jgi:putative ABC transport system permease protein
MVATSGIARFVSQNKAFAACILFSLGIGISVAAAIVAVVDSAWNGPVPFANADRLEVVYIGGRPLINRSYMLAPDVVRALVAPDSPFEDAALFRYRGGTIRDGERVADVSTMMEVSPSFPRLLSARMHLGRAFGVGDPPDERHLMLSHSVWTENFASDSSIVGRYVFLDSQPALVVGVTAREWAFPDRTHAWVSNAAMLSTRTGRDSRLLIVGLRKRDVDVQRARAMIETMGTAAMTARTNPGDRIESGPFRAFLALRLSSLLFAMGLAALFIALITAVNFAVLVLARGIKRRGEIGVRAALGASVPRLVRDVVAETLWLSAAGGVLAALLAPAVLNVIQVMFDRALPNWLTITMSWRIVVASVLMSMLLGTVFAIGPALDLARPALGSVLRATGSGISGTSRAARSRAWLVSIQVGLAAAFLVLFGATLGRALVLTRPNPGYDYARVILGSIGSQWRAAAVLPVVVANAEETPGVTHVALVQSRQVRADEVTFDGATGDTAAFDNVWIAQTAGTFYSIARPTLVAGRFPTDAEFQGSAPVAVVTEIVARRAFDGEALGRTIRIGALALTVIGVVEHLERSVVNPGRTAGVFSPIVEAPDRWTQMELWMRVGEPTRVPLVLRELKQRAQLNRFGARVAFRSLGALMDEQVRVFWAIARIVYAIFGVALALAAMGIYGLVAYTVAMRNREMAIREALGASRIRVAWLLIRGATVQTTIGLLGGALIATAAASNIRTDQFVLDTAAASTAIAFIIVSLTVFTSSLGPLRTTWRRDLAQVLRD